MIDAQFRSEERYSKISIAYEGKEEGALVCKTIDAIVAKHDLKPQSYTCNISDTKDVAVLEYHDDIDREAGAIFEEIVKTLNIKVIG
jgi:hypothetical protein